MACISNHYQDQELTEVALAAAKELDSARRIAMCAKMRRLAQEREPSVFPLQQVATAAMAKGVTGFTIGAISDYTQYGGVRKARSEKNPLVTVFHLALRRGRAEVMYWMRPWPRSAREYYMHSGP